MIHVLTACTVAIGRTNDFENTMREVLPIYEKHGGKIVGFWWAIGGDKNEAVWMHTWKSLEDYEKGVEETWNDKDFPIEKIANTIITHTEKILKPKDLSRPK